MSKKTSNIVEDNSTENGLSIFVKNEKEVQEKLFLLENPMYFRYCKGTLYIFDESTGCYETSMYALYHYIIKHSKYFNKKVKGRIKNYGQLDSLMSKVPRVIKQASCADEWFEETANSSLGLLLFKNGIYNMNTGIFINKFNPTLVFHEQIRYDFPERDEEEIKYAADLSFNLYLENPMPLVVAFARALAGDETVKKIHFIKGENTGKSQLVHMFHNTFGGYVNIFDEIHLYHTKRKNEAIKNQWIDRIRFARIIFTNVYDNKIFNGDEILKITSGEEMSVRIQRPREDISMVPHFTPFCMLNHLPIVEPINDKIRDSLVLYEFKNQFVDKVTKKNQLKVDRFLSEKIHEAKFIRGFIHLILDGYKYFLQNQQTEI